MSDFPAELSGAGIIERIESGQYPREIVETIARGFLPLPQDDLIPVLAFLTNSSDAAIAAAAKTSLTDVPSRSIHAFASNENAPAEHLALLFPVDWPEPFGLVMIEAMACGTPVVAYPRGSVPEIIENGVTGFLVANAAEAAQAVGMINQIDRHKCRSQYERRFTASRMAEDYEALYRQLLRGESTNVTIEDGVPVG